MSIVFASSWMRVNAWRSRWPSEELRRRGHDAYMIGPPRDGGRKATTGYAKDDTVIVHLNNQDWRGSSGDDHRIGAEGIVTYLRKEAGCRSVFVQADDDYFALDDMQKVGPWWGNLKRDVVGALKAADGFIASTPELAESWRRWCPGSVHVIRNYIPEWVTRIRKPKHDPPLVGWFGLMSGHERDIRMAAPGLKDLPMGVVGDPDGFARVTGNRPLYGKGIQLDMRTMYEHVSRFTVGVAPVVDDRFNRSKSWIKPLEFAALGIPCIASDVPAYRQLREASHPDIPIPVNLFADPVMFGTRAVEWIEMLQTNRAATYGDHLRLRIRERFTMETAGGDEWEKWAAEVGAS